MIVNCHVVPVNENRLSIKSVLCINDRYPVKIIYEVQRFVSFDL